MFSLNDFSYELPPELIARYPAAERSASRLLCLDKKSGRINHRTFNELLSLLKAGDLLIFNDTKVIPARLFGQKATGGKVEIFIDQILDNTRVLAQLRASKAPKPGTKIFLDLQKEITILAQQGELFELEFQNETKSVGEILQAIGHIPLPHYMDREDEAMDQERYQTVYAKNPGAIAAPTAGLHFDETLLTQLKMRGIEMAFVTLHVGRGTFQPIRVAKIKDHVMHKEYVEVSQEVCTKIKAAKTRGNKVIAVGTTSVRSLETAARNGPLNSFIGETDLFIFPGYEFKVIDAMITNFHLPQSTLLMLVCAWAGHLNTMQAYKNAIAAKYRFFSYGDAMWIGNDVF